MYLQCTTFSLGKHYPSHSLLETLSSVPTQRQIGSAYTGLREAQLGFKQVAYYDSRIHQTLRRTKGNLG